MREIKFRVWDKSEKKMYACAGFLSGQVVIILDDGRVLGKKDDDFILMQYTGLKDKNGREIYEGDIVTHAAIQRTGPVVYREDTACFAMEFEGGTTALSYALLSEKPWEVIGNIYENPELLKKDDKA